MDGAKLTGEWSEGEFTGKGEWSMRDGTQFTGTFTSGIPQGEGVFNFRSGFSQNGSYVNQQTDEENSIVIWHGSSFVQRK